MPGVRNCGSPYRHVGIGAFALSTSKGAASVPQADRKQALCRDIDNLMNPHEQDEDQASQPYPDSFFRRVDEGDDRLFYAEPRLVVHIDDSAIAAIGRYFHQELPSNGVILDLMSSWRSHLPEGLPRSQLVGLGLNAAEMRDNPALDRRLVHDINADPTLPFLDQTFDAVVVTVSVQYMTRPVEVFSEVRRVLRDGGAFHVIFSSRMFPTKAVAVWQRLDSRGRAQLIGTYFQRSGGWDSPAASDISPGPGAVGDPVYVVSAARAGDI